MLIKNAFYQGSQKTPGRFCQQYQIISTIVWILIVFGLAFPQPVLAQERDLLIVLPPDVSDFPTHAIQIKPAFGIHTQMADIQIDDLEVQENEKVVTVFELEKQKGGVHFTLVINGDGRMDVRDVIGESPYNRIQGVFRDWVQFRRFNPGDSLSLITQEGPAIRNSIDRSAWVQALEDYQPNFRSMVPDLTSLETALRLTEERVVPFGVDKALIYITPPPTAQEIIPLTTLAETARSAEIQVHVWMLGEEFFLNNDQGRALINLADRTGGQFFHYTGLEDLPDPETYLDGLGIFYNLRYETTIREKGTYTVRVAVDTPQGEIQGISGEFFIDVQPPKPILISPPAIIERQPPQDWDGAVASLNPVSMDLEFMLEFPDQYPREIAFSRLYVDGRIVDERTQVPFTSLSWDLTALDQPGNFMLQVKVEDSLGLTGETILTPVQVVLLLPEPEAQPSMQQVGLIVVWVLLGAATILIILWFGRNFLQTAFAQQIAKSIFEWRRKTDDEVINLADGPGRTLATLIPLMTTYQNWAEAAIPITQNHTAFGSDPDKVSQVLVGEDISGVHARMRASEGDFWLTDCGTVGGTWVNYVPIGKDPVQIRSGDLIHFGATGFRFTMIDMKAPPKAGTTRYKPIL